jgi:endogenous inhibitor of DNA gyrase (YacG/DUF329 family)
MIRRQTCPICQQELPLGDSAEGKWFPFCSRRCRDVDLLRWWDGRYAIVEPLDEERITPSEPPEE